MHALQGMCLLGRGGGRCVPILRLRLTRCFKPDDVQGRFVQQNGPWLVLWKAFIQSRGSRHHWPPLDVRVIRAGWLCVTAAAVVLTGRAPTWHD